MADLISTASTGSSYREYLTKMWWLLEILVAARLPISWRSVIEVKFNSSLCLFSSLFMERPSRVNFRTLAQHCHNIERLDLSDCKKITDQATHAISKHCAKLTSINLESCVNISDKSLKDISDGCPVSFPISFPFERENCCRIENHNHNMIGNERELDHVHSSTITMNCFFNFPFSQNLMEINVSWCDLITENGVEALARGCNKLKRFSSKGCKQVNNNAVICLATYCKSLEVLNLHSCDVSVVRLPIIRAFLRRCLHYFRFDCNNHKYINGNIVFHFVFHFPDHHRFVHSKNRRNVFTFTKTVRVEMRRIDRSHIDFVGSAQSILEYN